MAPALKTYRTAIGFHDAYVAAPSQKAALEAWGADGNLFAQGLAEVVTDPALTAEPLANPGKVIKRTRGNLSDHIAALPKSSPLRKKKAETKAEPPPSPKPKRKARPRPDRRPLAEAEKALADAERAQEAERRALAEKEAALRRERQAMARRHESELRRLDQARSEARETYERALEEWQQEQG